MDTPWKATVHPRTWTTKLLVTDPQQDEILKASLPTPPGHPRALLTLLEGLALWSGTRLDAAICVGPSSGPLPDAGSFGAAYPPREARSSASSSSATRCAARAS